jgi:hypothetical protein
MARPILTLLTDFGTADGYAGALKGVILGLCPEAQIIDISHEIPPRDIAQAALVLQSVVEYFPPGCIHLVVVDPGVGSERRALAIQTRRAFFVGPDNGVFGLVLQQAQVRQPADPVKLIELNERAFQLQAVSPTFHGRDIFAPAAAHLALGVPIERLGRPVGGFTQAPVCEPIQEGGRVLQGQVISVDRFGNCQCDITVDHLSALGCLVDLEISVGDLCLGPVRRTYADVAPGAPLALIGSSGRLELALRNGSIGRTLGIQPGAKVRVIRH